MHLCCSVSFMRCQPRQQQACVGIFHDMQTFLAPVKGAVLDMHHPSLIFSSFAILPSSYHRLPPVPLTKAQLLPCPSVVPDWRPLVFSTAKNSIAPRNQRNFIRHSPLFRDQAVLECAVNASLRSGISKIYFVTAPADRSGISKISFVTAPAAASAGPQQAREIMNSLTQHGGHAVGRDRLLGMWQAQ